MQGPLSSHLQADDGVLETSPVSLEILMMGNSYTSANSLDSIVDGVLSAASNSANVTSLTGGGMRLSQHSSNVASAGHQWNTTLNNGVWNWVVLQDQSQIPGFPRSHQEWISSKNGAVQLAQTIDDKGADSVLMMTWGRRDGDSVNTQRFPDFSTMQDELEAGYLDYRDNMSSYGDVWVAPVGLAFEHIHDQITADGGTPTNSGNLFYDLYSSDGSHPSISGSYLAALVIYATITGDDPVGLSHSTSLSNSVALELQQAASATVFNETAHLDYPWQLQNQLPPINLSAIPDGALAFEWVQQFGTDDSDFSINDVVVSPTGDIYALGTASGDSNTDHTIGGCNLPEFLFLFVVKFNSNRVCDWTANITGDDAEYNSGWSGSGISLDAQGGVYITGTIASPKTGQGTGYYFDSWGRSGKIDMSNCNGDCTIGFVAKLDSLGQWEWIRDGGSSNYGHGFHSIDTFQNGSSIITGEYGNDIILKNATSGGGIQVPPAYYDSRQGTVSKNIVVAMIDKDGGWEWASFLGSNGNYSAFNVNIYDNNYAYVSGTVAAGVSVMFGNYTLTKTGDVGGRVAFVAKINQYGEWQWAKTWDSSSSTSHGLAVASDSIGNVFFAGTTYGTNKVNGIGYSSGGYQNSFIAKLDSNGTWLWIEEVECSCTNSIDSIAVDVHDNALVAGTHSAQIQMDSIQVANAAGGGDIYLAKINSTGSWQYALNAGSSSSADSVGGLFSDRAGNGYLSGAIDSGSVRFGTINTQNSARNNWFIAKLTSDYDGDGDPDTNDNDDDDDYIIDVLDDCHYSPVGFKSISALDHDSDGCRDSDEDYDDDGDGLNDSIDDCDRGVTGWTSTNLSDFDQDGCMDALEDYDDDADGFKDYEDYCQRIPGNSTMEYEKGCPDSDGDGRPDILDPFNNDPTEWMDTDSDGVGNNSDAFPLDATQQSDTDGDGYGDEEYGNGGDSCPTIFGNSTIDRKGCIDSDGDGISDVNDGFPDDPSRWQDTDGDGYGDEEDAFPFDPTQHSDIDGDGFGDSDRGSNADKFLDDISQWSDIDGDGYGDNLTGNNSDAFIADPTQWTDADGDGYGDNSFGRNADAFPNDPTQWEDQDGDGFGDNLSGNDPDPYLFDFDNDGYNDSIDPLPNLASPGDIDNDGCLDEEDAFLTDFRECRDFDEDGIGDNADPDDDGDGWADTDEIRQDTDPFDASEYPVDVFQLMVPGTAIGLDGWDLIGIFGGFPIFAWLLFGFITRNSRAGRFETELNAARSKEELEQIAQRSEYALMIRMIGAHQGIRLERLRAELDDALDAEGIPVSEDMTGIVEQEMAEMDNPVDLPGGITEVPSSDAIGIVGEDGYEWLEQGDLTWYRPAGSGSDWDKWIQ